MRYIVTIGKVGSQDQWDEIKEADTEDALEHAKGTIKIYNEEVVKNTPWLSHLEVRRVHVIDARAPSRHNWVEYPKSSWNPEVLIYKCANCGIDGEWREGYPGIKRGYSYRSSVFARCDEAMKYNYLKGRLHENRNYRIHAHPRA